MDSKGVELGIIIINYKTPQLVIDCLDTVLPQLVGFDAKVVIVDNASNDSSVDLIRAWITENDTENKFTLVASKENSGFSGGNNTGVRQLKANNYLLLNSDTLLREGALAGLHYAAHKDDSVGLVSPRLEWPDGTPQESCFRFHSPLSELISSARTSVITKLFKRWNVPFPVTQDSIFYDWTSFACVLVKAEVFDKIGLMDEGYFMYFEDVAFAKHVKKAGWNVLNVPETHVVHLRGGSSPLKSQAELRKRLPRYFYESRARYFYQFHGGAGLLFANICWTIGHGIGLIRSLFSRSYQPAAAAYQWRDIWINFFEPLKPYTHPDNYDKT